MNKIILIGNIGKDLELQGTTSGKTYVNFSVTDLSNWYDRNVGENNKLKYNNKKKEYISPLGDMENVLLTEKEQEID